METSIFLSRLLGPLFIIISLSMIMNHHHYKQMLKKIGDNPLLIYLSGFLSYIMGMLIVLNHNIWALNGFVIITIIGWIGVIKGVFLILFPESSIKNTKKIKITKGLMDFLGILWLVLGFCMTYVGYSVLFL